MMITLFDQEQVTKAYAKEEAKKAMQEGMEKGMEKTKKEIFEKLTQQGFSAEKLKELFN